MNPIFFRKLSLTEITRFRFAFCVSYGFSVIYHFFWESLPAIKMGSAAYLPYHAIPLLGFLGNTPPSPQIYCAIFAALILALAAAAGGWFARPALLASFLLSIGLFGILTGYRPNLASAGPYRNFCLPIYFLFLLSVTPAIGRIRGRNLFTKNSATEDTYAWPISLLKLTVYMVFFSAAIAKLRYGTQWMDGQTLRTFLLEQNVFRPGAPGLALAAYPAVCQALSVLVVVGELSAPLVLLFPALEIPFVVGALLFHASVRIFLSVDGFFLFFLPCYLIFLSGDRARFLRKLIFRPRTP